MDIMYERCCGLDVRKQTVVACVLEPGSGRQPKKGSAARLPSQIEIDRDLSAYEAYVWALDAQPELDHEHELVLNGEVHR
jgi:hypothetical protein